MSAILLGGCGTRGTSYGQSCGIITGVGPGEGNFLFEGYMSYAASKPQIFADGAVIIVGVDTVDLQGDVFSKGSIILVDETDDGIEFRLATSKDTIRLTQPVTIFDSEYAEGDRLPIPEDGILQDVD